MNPTTKSKTLVAIVGAAAVAGCTLTRSDVRQDSIFPRMGLGNSGGQVVEPKWCTLTVTIVSKPIHDKVVNEVVWTAADEQIVGSEARRGLEANGLRVGVIEGSLPSELEKVLNAPPPDKVEPAEFHFPEGSNALVALADSTPQATLLMNRDGRASGKDYEHATGWCRVTANHSGATGVGLKIVPEIHHGPIVRKYDATQANAASLNPMTFTVKDGQAEETLRDLAASLTLQPGQTAVLGANPDRPGSLGAFLFTHTEANSNRLLQRVVLLRAGRSNVGIPGSMPTPTNHPRLLPVDPPELPRLPQSVSANRPM
jgi:hypothetical protein